MFINQPVPEWTPQYWEHVNRNIGLVSFEEQERIRTSKIAVLGVGGIGGAVAEILVRAGCQHLVIVDKDTFDGSNLNRQLCTLEDIGRYKVDVVELFLKNIDPDMTIDRYITISPDNINKVLEGVDLVALALDDPITSILVARECRKLGIPIAESWAVPILFCWFFTPESLDYESVYDLKTHHLSIRELYKQQEQLNLQSHNVLVLKIFDMLHVHRMFDREPGACEMMIQGKIGLRSFAPIVRLTADFLSMEIIFAGILKVKPMNLAPQITKIHYF